MISCESYAPLMECELNRFLTEVLSTEITYEPKTDLGESAYRDFWVLRNGLEVVGSAGLRELQPGIGELKCLFVHEHYRGLGWGKRLVERVLHEAKEYEMSHVRLDVKSSASAAISLYRNFGFYEIENYNGKEGPLLFMERSL